MKYKVLWLDDDHNDGLRFKGFKNQAKLKNFDVTYCEYSEDFLKKLSGNDWDAVIIDVVGKKNVDTSVNDRSFIEPFSKVIKEHPLLPWFVFSGQPSILYHDNYVKELISCNSESNQKIIYDKSKDIDELFQDLMTAVDTRLERIIRDKYKHVFALCTDEYIGKGTDKELMEILLFMHHPEKAINYKTYFTPLRMVLEHMFRSANKLGILHDNCIQGGKVNLSDSSLFLAGSQTKYSNGAKCSIAPFSKIIAENVKLILFITGGASHTTEVEVNDQYNLQAYWNEINTPYLLFSLTLMLCDVLVWYKQYADANPDVEKNKSYWISNNDIWDSSESLVGIVLKVHPNGFAFVKPDDSSGINCHLSASLVTEFDLHEGDHVEVSYSIDEKGRKTGKKPIKKGPSIILCK
jgi:hypothetical protein